MQLGTGRILFGFLYAVVTLAALATSTEVSEKNEIVESIGKCAEITEAPSILGRVQGKKLYYSGCAVDIENYYNLTGEHEAFRRSWENPSRSRDGLKEAVEKQKALMDEKLQTGRFHTVGMIVMGAVFVVGFLSLLTLFFNWFNLFWMTFRVRRRLCSLNEKMVIAEKMLARRRFADDLIEKLSRLAEFDVAMNEEEITKKLNSVYGGVDPAAKGNSA